MRRFMSWAIGLPLAILMVGFAIANRQWVTVSLDPLSRENPWFAFEIPMWVLLYAGIFIGILVGWCVAWFGQAKWRQASRKAESQLNVARMENERLKQASAGTSLIAADR